VESFSAVSRARYEPPLTSVSSAWDAADVGRPAWAATRSVDGKAGFTVPFIGVELGGGGGREHGSGHTVTVVFGGPVDREGNPVKVASAADVMPG
jgi:hypothetical protein